MDERRGPAVHASGNELIDALPGPDRALLLPWLEPQRCKSGHILYHPGDDVDYAYFPRLSALASYHVIMPEGSAVETAIVGRDGALGGIVSNGQLPAFARACVMHGGDFYRIPCEQLEQLKRESAPLRDLFVRYADCLVAQIFQSVACNATHTIGQRAAKWLIVAMERTGNARIAMTQDQLASLLGVGRSYVSRIIRRLRENGIVETRRGGIIVRDADRLEATSCDCHRLVARHFRRVLGESTGR